jgi:hypothetical protein
MRKTDYVEIIFECLKSVHRQLKKYNSYSEGFQKYPFISLEFNLHKLTFINNRFLGNHYRSLNEHMHLLIIYGAILKIYVS